MEQFFQQLTNGLAIGGIYALIALGYTLVYGVLKLINFAHGDLFTIGAFLGLSLLASFSLTDKLGFALGVGLLLGVIESLGAAYISMAWKDAITFAVLIAILIVRPTGLLGERVAEKI